MSWLRFQNNDWNRLIGLKTNFANSGKLIIKIINSFLIKIINYFLINKTNQSYFIIW